MADRDDDKSAPAAARRSSSKIDDDLWNDIVNEWTLTSLRNTALSADAGAWNHLVNVALPGLRKILDQKL